MMTVSELIQLGNLNEAISLATADIKQQPLRPELRVVLAELMCFAGNLDRADTLIDGATKVQKGPAPGLILMRQLLRGEVARNQWYEEGRPPETRSLPTQNLADALQIVVEYRGGDQAAAVNLAGTLAQPDLRQGVVHLTSDEQHNFVNFRDLNDLTGSVAELVSPAGKFFWVPWLEFSHVKFEPAKTLRDLLWRPVECTFKDGTLERYFMPCLYAGSALATVDSIRLGQTTDWKDLGDGLISGVGQRMFLAGDLTPSILDIAEIQFESTGSEHAKSR